MDKIYIYILAMSLATYAIRVLPLTLIRREIKNKYNISQTKFYKELNIFYNKIRSNILKLNNILVNILNNYILI